MCCYPTKALSFNMDHKPEEEQAEHKGHWHSDIEPKGPSHESPDQKGDECPDKARSDTAQHWSVPDNVVVKMDPRVGVT
jgi:hypothetical protein